MSDTDLKFSHFGLHVIDMPRMEDFYSRFLGFTVTDRGQLQRPSGAVDLSLPEAEIMSRAEAHARSMQGFRSRAQWRDEMAKRMAEGSGRSLT